MDSRRFTEQIDLTHTYLILMVIILFFILILNYSPTSNNLSAIFIEKERLKWYIPTGL